MTADAPTATARRMQIAMRGRVDEPGVRFAQSQPPRASSSGRRAAVEGVRTHVHRRRALPPETVRVRRMDILNFELEQRVMGEKSIRREREMRFAAVASRQQRQPRRPAAPTSGLRDRKAPKQTCAMRTGSFHRTISPLSIPRCPSACPHHMSNQAAARWICARRLAGQIPRLGRCDPRDVFRPSTCNNQ